MYNTFLTIIFVLLVSGCQSPWGYKVKKGQIVYGGPINSRISLQTVAEKADPETFTAFGELGYGKDLEKVFFRGLELVGADPDTFEEIGLSSVGSYSKDKQHVYYNLCLIKDADPATFQILAGLWSKDADNIYSPTQN